MQVSQATRTVWSATGRKQISGRDPTTTWPCRLSARETVLGDFNGASLTHFGVKTQFSQRDGRFLVNTEGPDGKMEDFEIKYVFGVDPLQQYLVEFPRGKLQCLTVAWATQEQRWFHLYPDEKIESGDPLHWTGRYQNWNLMVRRVPHHGLSERL